VNRKIRPVRGQSAAEAELYGHIGEKIRTRRERLGWTQTKLAQAMGVTPNTVSRWETAIYRPSALDLDRLARLFGIVIWGLFPPAVAAPTAAHKALLSATGDLPEEDLAELGRYADFIRARKTLTQESKNKRDPGSGTTGLG